MTGPGLDPAERAVRLAIYRSFAAAGRVASAAEIAAETGLAVADVTDAMRSLHDAHAIVLTSAGDAVRMAHPFSAAPMGFVVGADGAGPAGYAGDRMWWGGCAWDSFGIGAALGEPVVIRTRCPGCGRDLELRVGPDQPPGQGLVVHIPCEASHWWDDVVATCSNIRLFCDPSHVDAWARSGSRPVGQAIPAITMWRLAQTWYGNRLDPDWSPRPTAAAQQLLEERGLAGEFWRLPLPGRRGSASASLATGPRQNPPVRPRLLGEDVDAVAHAGLARGGQPVQMGPADQDGLGAEGQRGGGRSPP